MNFKNKFVIIASIPLLALGMISCTTPQPEPDQNVEVVEKFDKQEYDHFQSWFFDKPIYVQNFYFIIKFEDKSSKKEKVTDTLYYSTDVGDMLIYPKDFK